MENPTTRRLRALRRHLTAGRANVRPGDEDLAPVETSYFVAGAFRPRGDEARAVRFDAAGVPDGRALELCVDSETAAAVRFVCGMVSDFVGAPGVLGGLSRAELQQAALACDISLAPGTLFSAREDFRHGLRLNYGHPDDPRVLPAIATLGALIDDLARR